MVSRAEQQARGLSVRQLTFIFFGVVGLCAVFFALGFLVGANRRNPAASPMVEQVPPPSEVPAPINPPLQDSKAGGTSPSSKSRSQSASIVEQDLPGFRSGSHPAATTGTARTGQPSRTRTPPAAQRRGQPGVVVQVAALRTGRDARSLLHVLRSHGYRAVLITPKAAHAGDKLYRVQVGPFPSRSEAMRSVQKLSRQGFRPFIKE